MCPGVIVKPQQRVGLGPLGTVALWGEGVITDYQHVLIFGAT